MLVAPYRGALTLGRRIRESERLWEAIDGDRVRSGLDERNMGSLYNAAVGLRVRRPDHIEYADVSERVATSDLKKVVEARFLRAVGERRGRHYIASDHLRQLQLQIQEERKSTQILSDPARDWRSPASAPSEQGPRLGSQVGSHSVWTAMDGCGRRWTRRPCISSCVDGCGLPRTPLGDLRIRRLGIREPGNSACSTAGTRRGAGSSVPDRAP
jgi:hypothetical protein